MENRHSKENLLLLVPESEFHFETFLSSGPGGQNVQKNQSAVRLRWNPSKDALRLSGEERAQVAERLSNEQDMDKRLMKRGERFDYEFTNNGDLLITAHRGRDQEQNKKRAKEKFYVLLEEALRKDPERKKFRKPHKTERERRETSLHSLKKERRKSITSWEE